jgi:RsiW-degrading membrane proteinase PrsW (M82 family)
MLVVKNTERRMREPTGRILFGFFNGATLSVGMAVIIEVILIYVIFSQAILPASELLGRYPGLDTLIIACIIAPFVEELTKAIGIMPLSRRARELEDGIIFGAVVGLGFAATENFFYETSAYAEGGAVLLVGTVILRTISSALLHASASAITGYGLAAKRFMNKSWLPYYLLAVLLHGIFNLAASSGPLLEGSFGESSYLIGLFAAITLALVAFSWSRRKIRYIERSSV